VNNNYQITMMSVRLCVPLLTFECLKLGMYIMAPEPISTAYFINPSHQSFCLYVYPPLVARQHLGKSFTAARNTYAIEDLLDSSLCMRSVSYQRKIGDLFFPELL
jgi:hypothetical protein